MPTDAMYCDRGLEDVAEGRLFRREEAVLDTESWLLAPAACCCVLGVVVERVCRITIKVSLKSM